MKKHFALVSLFFATAVCFAAPIAQKDAGTYVVMAKDGKASDLYYRLTLTGNLWKMEGKEAAGSWQDISCERSCEYKVTTTDVANSYLPKAMRDTYDIACINNVAQAFCRYTLKANPKQGGYVVVALVTGQPTLILLQRVALLSDA